MSKHTPGPWRVMPREGMRRHSQMFIHAESTSRFAIAQVYSVPNSEIREANARLIAAAPELLEALTKLANEATAFSSVAAASDYVAMFGVTNMRILKQRIEEARAAIAKAGAQ